MRAEWVLHARLRELLREMGGGEEGGREHQVEAFDGI